jgi:hypothetical protein
MILSLRFLTFLILSILPTYAWSNDPADPEPLAQRIQQPQTQKPKTWSIARLEGEYRLRTNQPDCSPEIRIQVDADKGILNLSERDSNKEWPAPRLTLVQIDREPVILNSPAQKGKPTRTIRAFTRNNQVVMESIADKSRREVKIEQVRDGGVLLNETGAIKRENCAYQKLDHARR